MSSTQEPGTVVPVTDSLRRLGNRGHKAALGALVLILLWLVYLAFHSDEIIVQAMQGLGPIEKPPAPLADFAAKLILTGPALVFAFALWRLSELFGQIKLGQYLMPRAQGLLLQLGWLAWLSSIFSIICRTLGILLLSSNNPPGKKLLSIALDSGAISGLIIGFLLFIFALLLREMAAIAEENRSVI
jgi:hypothetical protein